MQRNMGRLAWRRAWTVAAAAIAAVAAALALWVVPAFSGGAPGEWTWVSGQVFADGTPDTGTAILTAYNGSSDPQQVTVRAINPNGTTVAPTGPATQTIAPGATLQFGWDCAVGFGCVRVFELRTQSPDVVAGLIYDEPETTGTSYTGLVAPGGFQVFGPNQGSTASTVQTISGAAGALQTDTAKLQSDNATLKADTAALQVDTAKLRKDNKQLKKRLKQVLKAVR